MSELPTATVTPAALAGMVKGFSRSDYPALASATSEAASASQRVFRWLSAVELGLLLLTSALLALQSTSYVEEHGYLSTIRIAVVVVLAAAIVVKSAAWVKRTDINWLEGRAVAEAAKSESWRYMMRVPPFDGDESAARTALQQQFHGLLYRYPATLREMHRLPPDQRQITERMRTIRAFDVIERRDMYDVARVQDQISWYHQKSRQNHRRARLWFLLSFALQLTALLLALAPIIDKDLPIIQFAVTVTVATTALNRWTQHENISKAYGIAAEQMSLLRESLDLVESQEALTEVVRDVEAVLNREQGAWLSRRG